MISCVFLKCKTSVSWPASAMVDTRNFWRELEEIIGWWTQNLQKI